MTSPGITKEDLHELATTLGQRIEATRDELATGLGQRIDATRDDIKEVTVTLAAHTATLAAHATALESLAVEARGTRVRLDSLAVDARADRVRLDSVADAVHRNGVLLEKLGDKVQLAFEGITNNQDLEALTRRVTKLEERLGRR